MLKIALLTLGDPERLTGGYLYHRRIAELAPRYGAQIDFLAFPQLPFPCPLLWGPWLLAQVRRCGARAILLDSICCGYLAPWLALFPTVPIFGILHQGPGGIGQSRLRSWLQAPLDRWSYRFMHRLLVASQSLSEEMGNPLPLDNLVVAPGCDVATDVVPMGPLRKGRGAALLCVANWARMKDLVSLLKAFAPLPESLATLHLAGDEQADPAYAQQVLAELRPLGDRVVRHGACTREQVAGLYEAADLFVLPSLRETYGTVYGEALRFGLPCIGWDTGNLRYLIEDGKEGRILPAGQVQQLSDALAELCRDEPLRQKMSQAARRRGQHLPTWEGTTQLIVETIRKALP